VTLFSALKSAFELLGIGSPGAKEVVLLAIPTDRQGLELMPIEEERLLSKGWQESLFLAQPQKRLPPESRLTTMKGFFGKPKGGLALNQG